MKSKKLILFYPVGEKITGQQLATEMIIDNFDDTLALIPVKRKIPVFNREKSSLKYNISYSLLTIGFWLKILGLIFRKSSVLYLNIGQSWISILRDGLLFAFVLRLRRSHKGIISMHGNWFVSWHKNSLKMKFMRFILNSTKVITVLGANQQESLISKGVKAEVIKIVPNASEITPLSQEKVISKQRDNEHIHILFLSNLIPSKGYREYVRAIEMLADDKNITQKITAVICGSFLSCGFSQDSSGNSPQQWLDAKLKLINSSANIQIKHINGAYGKAKEELFKESQIFILPSLIEAQPIVLLEAMSTGNTSISSMAGEIPSTLPDEAGIKLENPTSENVKKSIIKLLSNPEKRKEKALAALSVWQNNYSIKIYSEAWMKIFKELI